MEAGRPTHVVRFEDLELNLRAGELCRSGVRVKLQEQSFQILAMLLEHPGELVTREQIQKRLWPNDTVVEFENSINAAIMRLRRAVGDDADEPRYIETLARRGYRFIAPVDGHVDGSRELDDAALTVPAFGEQPIPVRVNADRRTLRPGVIAAGAVIVLAALLGLRVTRQPSPPRITRTVQLTNDGREKSGFPVTNGPRLYFTEQTTRGNDLVEMSTEGREMTTLSMPFQPAYIGDISPGGTELLFGQRMRGVETEMPLWAKPVPRGFPRRVGNVLAHDGSWSPSGREIVYANGQDLYVANPDGSSSHKLASLSAAAFGTHFSPDGTRLRFTLNDFQKGDSSIWEVSAKGTGLRRMLPGWTDWHCCGNWTPDGRYFVFEANRNGGHNIWALREKAGLLDKPRREPVQLTTGPMMYESPVPSRDGKKLYVLGLQMRGELIRYELRSRELVPYLSGMAVYAVEFSRDGQWVAYVSFHDGTLWRMRADGSERLQLSSQGGVSIPRWSPDGKQLAFVASAPGRPSKIHVVSAEGGSPQQLIPGEGNEFAPDWSPDGNSLMFVRPSFSEAQATGAMSIQLLDLNTNQISTLPGSEGLWSPRWSPDGKYLAAVSHDKNRLLLFDFKTREWTDLAKPNGMRRQISSPLWSPNGTYVYFWDSSGSYGVYRVGISHRKVEPVVRVNDLHRPDWASADGWFALAPDGSLILSHEVDTIEVYALDWQAP